MVERSKSDDEAQLLIEEKISQEKNDMESYIGLTTFIKMLSDSVWFFWFFFPPYFILNFEFLTEKTGSRAQYVPGRAVYDVAICGPITRDPQRI